MNTQSQLTVILEDIATKEREELELKAGDNQFIYVPVNIAHVVVSKTSDDILLVTASRHEASADKFPYQVL